MKKRQLRNIARGAACSVALAGVGPAWAGTIDIQMPQKGDAVAGANIACLAQFKSPDRPITKVEFLVDGHELVPKLYPQPTSQARVTFVWDATGVPGGSHVLSVRAFAGSSLVGEDQVPVIVSPGGTDIVKPQVHIYFPKPNSILQGQQDVAIHANDNTGVAIVSLFIDKQLKLLQNVPPYRYTWDTTQYANGPHTLEVWAFDSAQNKGEAQPVRVFVNNPTGRTEIRDLPDEVPATAAHSAKLPTHAAPVQLKRASKPPKPSAHPSGPAVSADHPTQVAAATPPHMPAAPAAAVAARVRSTAHPDARIASLPHAHSVQAPEIPAMKSPVHPVPAASPKPAASNRHLPGTALMPSFIAVPVRPHSGISSHPAARSPHSTSAAYSTPPQRIPIARSAKATSTAALSSLAQPSSPAPIHTRQVPPATARAPLSPADSPVLMVRLPDAPPMASIDPALRAARPSIPASVARRPVAVTPSIASSTVRPRTVTQSRAAVRPLAPIRSQAAVRPATATHAAPVRIARAEIRPGETLGHARAEEAESFSPAAHRTLVARVPLRILLGQDPIDFDVQPVIRQGMAIAPIRQIIEHTGGVVIWIPSNRTVQATSGSHRLELKIGSRRALVNSEVVLMERPATLKSGRTMVPVRFLQVALDMKALYDPNKGLVCLYTK